MKKDSIVVASMLLAMSAQAQDPPAEVLLFGVFHFHNPGRDVVRVEQTDVTTPDNQLYLQRLAMRLCAFGPTMILLEFDRSREPEINRELETYVADGSELAANEIYQIGFRVAKACGVETLHGIDESDLGWNAEPLFEYLEESAPDLLDAFNDSVLRVQESDAEAHRELSLRELLIRANDAEQDRMNKDLYFVTSAAGAGTSFEGADAAARWWHRNFRMFANIQRYALPGERVLVVAGSGHTAILRDFLEIDGRIRAADIHEYL